MENKEIDQYIEELEAQKDELEAAAIILGRVAFIGVLGILVTGSICGGLG